MFLIKFILLFVILIYSPKEMEYLLKGGKKQKENMQQEDEYYTSEQSHVDIPGWEKIFGTGARTNYMDQFRVAYRQLEVSRDGARNYTASQNSPRTRYLRQVARKRLPPLPLLLRKVHDPNCLNLGNKGLGDEKLLPVIEVLNQLPALTKLILCDNRLTDESLMPLMIKLRGLPGLVHLDLSFNKIDKSSEYLMMFLRDESCKLQILKLNGSDVDDVECSYLAEALNGMQHDYIFIFDHYLDLTILFAYFGSLILCFAQTIILFCLYH